MCPLTWGSASSLAIASGVKANAIQRKMVRVWTVRVLPSSIVVCIVEMQWDCDLQNMPSGSRTLLKSRCQSKSLFAQACEDLREMQKPSQ